MRLKIIFIFLLVTSALFYPFIIQGKIPFPGNYMLAWYQPWKSVNSQGEFIAISHKPVVSDTFRQFFPYKVLIADQLKKFQLPLWNPYNGSGTPFLATMHIGMLTPFNIFFLIFPAKIAWGVYLVFQFVLVLIFTYLFARKIKISTEGSILTALSFGLSGVVVVGLLVTEFIYPISLLPFMLYIIESYLNEDKSKAIYLLTPTTLILFLSGHPQMIFYAFVFTILYLIFRAKHLNISYRTSKIGRLVFFLILGLTMASIQLIPTLELARNANLSTISSKFIFNKFLVPIQDLITIYIPNYFGNQSTYNYWGSSDYVETINYIGTIPFLFAFIAVVKTIRKKSITEFFTCSVILTCLLTINWPLPKLLFSLPIPIISTGAPSRIFILTSFSLAILAGIGFDYVKSNLLSAEKFLKASFPVLLLLLITLIGTLYAYKTALSCNNKNILDCRSIALRNTIFELSGFLLFFIVLLFSFKKSLGRFAWILIFLILMSIGIYNGNKFLPFTKSELMMPEDPLITELKNHTNRTFGFGEANIKTDFATYYHFYDTNYYDPLYIKRYGELVAYARGKNLETLPRSDVEIINNLKLAPDQEFKRDRIFDYTAVDWLIYKKTQTDRPSVWEDENWKIIERKNAIPRVFTVGKVEIITKNDEVLKRMFDKNFNPMTTAVLEKQIKEDLQPLASKPTIESVIDQLNSVIIKIQSPTNTFLILSDNYFPGWNAYIDGRQTEIYRTNYTFRGIFVPKGSHAIEFRYFPQSLKIGAIISLISFFFYVTGIRRFFRPKTSRDKKSR